MSPFSTISDYSSMLNKIGLFTFGIALGAIALLRWQVQSIDDALKAISISVPLMGGVILPLGTVLPALLIGVASRMIKLHNVVSTIFGIRRRFDVEHILFPLAVAAGVKLTTSQMEQIYKKRTELMRKIFYAYASSTKEKALIYPHYITMALDQWSWYWMLVEANVVMIATGIVFLIVDMPKWTVVLLAVPLVVLAVLIYLKAQCADYARAEIDEILKVKDASRRIADELHAL